MVLPVFRRCYGCASHMGWRGWWARGRLPAEKFSKCPRAQRLGSSDPCPPPHSNLLPGSWALATPGRQVGTWPVVQTPQLLRRGIPPGLQARAVPTEVQRAPWRPGGTSDAHARPGWRAQGLTISSPGWGIICDSDVASVLLLRLCPPLGREYSVGSPRWQSCIAVTAEAGSPSPNS